MTHWHHNTDVGNYVLGGAEAGYDWWVSYNPGRYPPLAELLSEIMGLENGEETALYIDGEWCILTGDYREEYAKAWPDRDECIAVYERNKLKHRCDWSTDTRTIQ